MISPASRTILFCGLALACYATSAWAGALGIPADAFLTRFGQFITGLGWPVGILGLLGWAAAHLNNTFGTMIGGSINLFGTAGLLGGGAVIMQQLGLVQGAVLL